MNNQKLLTAHCLLLTAYCLLLLGCRERIEISTDNAAPQLVIIGHVTTDTMAHIVSISQTIGYFGAGTPKTYDNAVVTINGELLQALGDGRYATDEGFYGEPGETYLLEVYLDKDNNGNTRYYTASATMPPMHVLDSITLRFFRYNHNGEATWAIYVNFQDIPNVPNLFGAHLYVNSEKYSNKLRRYFLNFFDESAADGQYIRFFTYILRHDMRWDNEDHFFYIYTGDTLTLEFNMLDRTYFNYIRAAKSEVSGNNPIFAGPPANLPCNIQGGALGIFGAYTTSRKSLILTEEYGFPEREE